MNADAAPVKKKVDRDWLERVEKERLAEEAKAAQNTSTKEKKNPPSDPHLAKSFQSLVSSLAIQAYMGLGEMEDPATGLKSVHLEQAQTMIEMLLALQERTRGNLSADEENALNRLVYELRLKFTEKNTGPAPV